MKPNTSNKEEHDVGNTDSYLTPDFILKMFDGWFDPCPYNDNPEIDGLKIEWKDKTFVNPPYSKPLPWVEKAIEESKKGKIIALLLKCDTSTKVWLKLHEINANIMLFNGRLRFRKKEWDHFDKVPAMFPSMLVVLYG